MLKTKMDLNSCLGFLQCMFVLFSTQHYSFQAVLTTTPGEVVCLFPCVLVNHTVYLHAFKKQKKFLQVLLLNWLPRCDTGLLPSTCFEWFCLGLVVKAKRKKPNQNNKAGTVKPQAIKGRVFKAICLSREDMWFHWLNADWETGTCNF